jgi:nitronate monooxygenase
MLPSALAERLRLPLIAAPMTGVSGPELVAAACAAGIIGSFPSANAPSAVVLDEWLTKLNAAERGHAPYAVNLIMRHNRLAADVDLVTQHRVPVVITSVGSPAPIMDRLHAAGTVVLADVATLRHAHRALEAGVDGLVLLTAGAGGQTGWVNPFAFVRAVREFYDGTVVLAGGISDGCALHAARVLGVDLAYMGTRFIATTESLASAGYKQMLVDSDLDDVLVTRAFTGLSTSMLAPAIRAAGLDPAHLDERVSPEAATQLYGGTGPGLLPAHWVDAWSAGHTVCAVKRVETVAQVVEAVAAEFSAAGGAG